MTHNDLVKRAERWLRGTMRCGVVLCEVVGSGWEQPDAIGWKHGGHHSVLVECKTSRADFLRDKKKWHRQSREHSMGQERWYLAPSGIIQPEELPEGWGLIEVRGKQIRKVKQSAKVQIYDSEIMRSEIMLMFAALRKIELGISIDHVEELDGA